MIKIKSVLREVDMVLKFSHIVALFLIVFGLSNNTTADEINFARDIRPILSENCFQCHGPDAKAREADLRLDTKEGLFGKRDDAVAVTPGKPNESGLIERIASSDEDERMPPADSNLSLTGDEIDLLKRWIESGAEWSGHWSFQPIKTPKSVDLREAIATYHEETKADDAEVRRIENWPRGEMDRYVLRRMLAEKMRPSQQASPERLIRRVTLDLTGLPPTLEEIDAFIADTSPDAYERLADRLLASPRYGERMAWDWLDAARYADSNGFQGDNERTMWPWRDWVVRAMNDNMPFDRFTIHQLAGDQLPEPTLDQRLATGFCRNHMINGEGGRIAEENRIEYIFDQIETVGTVWMGMTFHCSRCHDHKFDPLRRKDYYQLFAFFNQTQVTGGGGSPRTPPVMVVPSLIDRKQLQELKRAITATAGELVSFEKTYFQRPEGKPVSVAETAVKLPEPIRKSLDLPVGKRNVKQLEELEKQFAKSNADYSARLRRLRELQTRTNKLNESLPRVMVMQDMDKRRETFMLDKGQYNHRQETVEAAVPEMFTSLSDDAPKNRLALARWLVDPAHPLTARVTVNLHWQKFFGAGLAKTSEDLGSQGERPSHPQLLDLLSRGLIDGGWNIKGLHRRIVLSATYRQSARATAEMIDRDVENRLLARGPRFRLPAWMIRDQALAVGGLLAGQIGGAPVKPYQPNGVWAEATFGKKRYKQDQGEGLYRRGIYTFWRRIVGPTIFFDSARRQTCEVKIARTNTPLHALTTLNDVTFVEAARALAQRVLTAPGMSTEQRVAMAFRLVTSRRPSADERQVLLGRLRVLTEQFKKTPKEAGKLLSVGAMPRDKQLGATEHAAYTSLCLMILNLDESLSK